MNDSLINSESYFLSAYPYLVDRADVNAPRLVPVSQRLEVDGWHLEVHLLENKKVRKTLLYTY